VVVVEDHMLVREGLIAILETYPDIEVVGSAGDSGGALAAVAEQQPDTLLLDVKIPGDEVTVTVTRVQKISPRTRIVILSMYDGPELVRKLLDLGVDGYLLKNATRHQLVAAIRGVHSDDGGIVLFVSRQSLAQLQDGGPAVLTPRERDVLELVARAMSNAQVAAKLYLTEATVKRHLRNAFVKLGAVSRIDAVNKATAAAQISPRPENVGVVEALPASSVAGHHRPIREQPHRGQRPS
jgi:DNA-binding NarL/FixJ family response regulator